MHKTITRNAINGIRGCWMSIAAIFALAALRASATDYGWNPAIYEGYLNENWYDANQQSGTPGAGDSENISSAAGTYSGVYTIKVPAAEYVDGPRLQVGDLPSGTKVTFDATGSAWVKQRGSTDPAWGNDPLFNVANSGGSIFSIYNKTGTLGFTLQNGKISADFGASGSLFKFESGTFNNAYHIDQTTESTCITFIGNTTSPGSLAELAGGISHLRNVTVFGSSTESGLLVSGGTNNIYGGLWVNWSDASVDGTVRVSGGELALRSCDAQIGCNANGRGVVKVDGTGKLTVSDNVLSLGGVDNAEAVLELAGNGSAYINSLIAANGTGRKGTVSIADSATLEVVKLASIGSTDSSEASFVMTGGHVVQKFEEESKTESFFMGNNSGSKVTVNISGGEWSDGNGRSAQSTLVFGGGIGSANVISGGNIQVYNLSVQGVQNHPEWTNVVRQTGGTVSLSRGSHTGFDICGNNRNAMYLLEGGDLNFGAFYFRIGYGGPNNGYHAVFRQTGGTLRTTAGLVNMCDTAGADGDMEFLGGKSYVSDIRGWTGCVIRGSTGWARCYFNGGTILPAKDGCTLIYTMTECSLGPNGGKFDTDGKNASIRAKFQNDGDGTESEANGLFVKSGSGTLTAYMVEEGGDAIAEAYRNRDIRSYHSRTRIDGGTMLLAGADNVAFGRNVTVSRGGTLSLVGDAKTLEVDTLVLGSADGTGTATLALDIGDTVVITNVANGLTANGGAVASTWSANGTYPVFVCKGEVPDSVLASISIESSARKDFAWTSEYDAEKGVTTCSVFVADYGTLGKTITYGADSVTTNGTGRIANLVATADQVQSGVLDLTYAPIANVDSNVTLRLDGSLEVVENGAVLTKKGSGKLVVNGDNSGYNGSFSSGGGILEFMRPTAFGANPVGYPLVLGGGTLRYDGNDPVTFDAALRIAADEHLKPVILDNDGDLTFNSAEYVQGLFIKKGTGTLKFDLPAGTFAIGVNSADENIGENAGQIEFPETGDSPTSTSGLLGINILEGTMKVVGVSSNQTYLYAQNTATIGGGYRGAVPAVLEVEKARVYWGGSSRHGFMCRYLPDNTPAPELHLNDAYFWTDSIHLGSSSAGSDTTVKVTMTNSTFWGQYNANVGSSTVAVKIDANNSKLHSNADIGWTIQAKRLDADFYGQDALFASQSKSGSYNATGRFWFYDQVTGLIKVRNGATLQTTRGVRMNGSTVDVVFDGGKFSILAHNTELETQSMWNANKGSGFNSMGAGLELQIPDTCIHSFNFPIYGGGSVTKTGAGTFKLVSPRTAGEKLLQYTGGTIVSNGTFVIDGSLVADGAKSFAVASDAVMDLNGTMLSGATLSGAGTVTNGTLSAATILYNATTGALTFSGVAFDGVLTVDFGCTAENPLDIEGARAGFVVARYTGDMPAGLVVKPVNTGLVRPHARVSVADGNISVSVVNLGLSVFLR